MVNSHEGPSLGPLWICHFGSDGRWRCRDEVDRYFEGTRGWFHRAASALICSNFRTAGFPSRRMVARLRSLGSNVIALAIAEPNFILPWSVRVTSSSGSKLICTPTLKAGLPKPAYAPPLPEPRLGNQS